MQTIKMSLANIQGKLSRTEMKNIMAGRDFGGGGYCGGGCSGSVGDWIYTNGNASISSCSSDILTYCSSRQGYCSPC